MEVWKNLKLGDGTYYVSNLGRVKRIYTLKNSPEVRERLQKPTIIKGYSFCSITDNGKQKKFSIHRLVCLLFIPNPENKPNVNHKDFDKSNNTLYNLEWCTQKENVIHLYKNKVIVRKPKELRKTKQVPQSKVILVKLIKDMLNNGFSNNDIARSIKVGHRFVSVIKLNKLKMYSKI